MARLSMAAALLLLLAAAALPSAWAGCYNGRPHAPVPPHLSFLNHSPAPVPKHMPKAWDWGDVDGVSMLTPSWNQHEPTYCGSCWAHASLSMLSDRLKISKKGVGPDVMLSRQTLLNCAAFKGYGGGCDGGDPIDVFQFMAKEGLPDESCLTYSATDHTRYEKMGLKHCPAGGYCLNCMPVKGEDTCWPVKTPILYYVTSYGRIGSPDASPADNARAMQAELLARGPIVCSIATPDAFTYGYRGGIFDDHNTSTIDDVDHDISIVGYGEDEETGRPYWTVRNSWGIWWGEMGFFKIPRGENALFVEAGDCWAATIEHGMEDDVRAGRTVGSMYGIVKRKGGGGGGRRAHGAGGLERPSAV